MTSTENAYRGPLENGNLPDRKSPSNQSQIPGANFFAISSIACIASPELLPGAGSPQRFMEGKALYRSNWGEPKDHARMQKKKRDHLTRVIPHIEFFPGLWATCDKEHPPEHTPASLVP